MSDQSSYCLTCPHCNRRFRVVNPVSEEPSVHTVPCLNCWEKVRHAVVLINDTVIAQEGK